MKRGMIEPDDGYYFGLGAFETIAVEENRPLFLKEHLERLGQALKTLGLSDGTRNGALFVTAGQVDSWLDTHPVDRGALKIVVSQKNILFLERGNPYTEAHYVQGFQAAVSEIRRNSTSPFTYIKSLNYGDCILEKRRAKETGIDEPLFLNERNELCEGAVSNLFFVGKDGTVATPKVSCGLLPGVVRRVLLEHGMAGEAVILPEELGSFSEAFLTNSLMGIMPVSKIIGQGGEVISFGKRTVTEQIRRFYEAVKREEMMR